MELARLLLTLLALAADRLLLTEFRELKILEVLATELALLRELREWLLTPLSRAD